METGLYNNDFSSTFNKLLARAGVTCYQIHQFSSIDQGYLSNLRNGKKNNPSPETIVKISLALAHFGSKIKLYEIESLFRSAGRSIHV